MAARCGGQRCQPAALPGAHPAMAGPTCLPHTPSAGGTDTITLVCHPSTAVGGWHDMTKKNVDGEYQLISSWINCNAAIWGGFLEDFYSSHLCKRAPLQSWHLQGTARKVWLGGCLASTMHLVLHFVLSPTERPGCTAMLCIAQTLPASGKPSCNNL